MLQGLINWFAKFADSIYLTAFKSIDVVHTKIHSGMHYTVSRAVASVANAASIDIRFKTGDKRCHTAFEISSSGKSQFFVYQAATISAGTALTAYNNNLTSARATTATITHTPTVTSAGTDIIITKFLGAGSPGVAVGAIGNSRNEFMLKANTEYLIRLTNTAGTAQDLGVIVEYYEEE